MKFYDGMIVGFVIGIPFGILILGMLMEYFNRGAYDDKGRIEIGQRR